MHSLGISKRVAKAAAGLVALAVPLTLGLAPAQAAAPHPDIQLKQNASDSIGGPGIACHDTTSGTLLDNQVLRRYDLSQYGASNGVSVSSIDFGVQDSDGGTPGDTPATVEVYAIDHAAALTMANLGSPISQVPTDLATFAAGTIAAVPISATVPAGKDMVISLTVPGSAEGQVFFIGTNASAQSADGYIVAADCGATQPLGFSDLGLGDLTVVLFATGKTTDCKTAETTTNAAEATAATAKTAATSANAAVTSATSAKAAADGKVKKAKAKLKKAKKSDNATKIEKAEKKVKKAKAAAKAAAGALAAAQTKAAAANAAATTANAAVATATAAANTKCAQPALPPALHPAPSGQQVQVKSGFSFTSR